VIEKSGSLPLLVAAVIVALLANVLFFATYPLNVGQWDNATFVRMILRGNSNLTHASGYPAIMYFIGIFVFPKTQFPVEDSNPVNDHWFKTVQATQVVLHLVLFLICIFLCAKTFGRSVASLLALGWGGNTLFLANLNSAAPEWLEADGIILTFLLYAYARHRSNDGKILAYSFAAIVFSITYLVKPNSLLFAVALLPVLLLDNAGWRFKLPQLLTSAAIFILLTTTYARTYHYSTTRSIQLNYDHGWVMTAGLPPDYLSSPPEKLGINSLKWSALVRSTPPDYSLSGWVGDINWGSPPDIRKEYTAKLEEIERMSRDELVQFTKSHPLPEGYSSWAAAVPLNYFYGLVPMDALGQRVYWESYRSHPGHHLHNVWRDLGSLFKVGVSRSPMFPTFREPLGLTFQSADYSKFLGEVSVLPPPQAIVWGMDYFNPRQRVMYRGMRAIEVLHRITSAGLLYLMLNIVALVGLFSLRSDLERFGAALCVLCGLGCFVSGSAVLLGLRHKELTALAPMYFLFLSICLVAFSHRFLSGPLSALAFRRRGNLSTTQ
jgi:hypothetical protein